MKRLLSSKQSPRRYNSMSEEAQQVPEDPPSSETTPTLSSTNDKDSSSTTAIDTMADLTTSNTDVVTINVSTALSGMESHAHPDRIPPAVTSAALSHAFSTAISHALPTAISHAHPDETPPTIMSAAISHAHPDRVPTTITSAASPPVASEPSTTNMELEFTETPQSLGDIVKEHQLPRVVKCDRISAPSVDLPLDICRPLLIYTKRSIRKVGGRSVVYDRSVGRYEETGNDILVPEDYTGWFGVLGSPNKIKTEGCIPHFRNVFRLALSPCSEFLVGGSTPIWSYTRISENHEWQSHKIFPGTVLRKGVMLEGPEASKKKDKKKDKKKGNAQSKETNFYLRCYDKEEREVTLHGSQEGVFYILEQDGAPVKSPVLHIRDILQRYKFPLLVKLLYGAVPTTPCAFKDTLLLTEASVSHTVIASTLDNIKNINLEIPIDNDMMFYLAAHKPGLTQSRQYKQAIADCKTKVHRYMKNMKILYGATPINNGYQSPAKDKSPSRQSTTSTDSASSVSTTSSPTSPTTRPGSTETPGIPIMRNRSSGVSRLSVISRVITLNSENETIFAPDILPCPNSPKTPGSSPSVKTKHLSFKTKPREVDQNSLPPKNLDIIQYFIPPQCPDTIKCKQGPPPMRRAVSDISQETRPKNALSIAHYETPNDLFVDNTEDDVYGSLWTSSSRSSDASGIEIPNRPTSLTSQLSNKSSYSSGQSPIASPNPTRLNKSFAISSSAPGAFHNFTINTSPRHSRHNSGDQVNSQTVVHGRNLSLLGPGSVPPPPTSPLPPTPDALPLTVKANPKLTTETPSWPSCHVSIVEEEPEYLNEGRNADGAIAGTRNKSSNTPDKDLTKPLKDQNQSQQSQRDVFHCLSYEKNEDRCSHVYADADYPSDGQIKRVGSQSPSANVTGSSSSSSSSAFSSDVTDSKSNKPNQENTVLNNANSNLPTPAPHVLFNKNGGYLTPSDVSGESITIYNLSDTTHLRGSPSSNTYEEPSSVWRATPGVYDGYVLYELEDASPPKRSDSGVYEGEDILSVSSPDDAGGHAMPPVRLRTCDETFNHSSTCDETINHSSTYDQPSNHSSTYDEPSNHSSTYDQPSNHSSTYETPSNHSSTYDQTSMRNSTYDLPRDSTYDRSLSQNTNKTRVSFHGSVNTLSRDSTYDCPSVGDSIYAQPSSRASYMQPSDITHSLPKSIKKSISIVEELNERLKKLNHGDRIQTKNETVSLIGPDVYLNQLASENSNSPGADDAVYSEPNSVTPVSNSSLLSDTPSPNCRPIDLKIAVKMPPLPKDQPNQTSPNLKRHQSTTPTPPSNHPGGLHPLHGNEADSPPPLPKNHPTKDLNISSPLVALTRVHASPSTATSLAKEALIAELQKTGLKPSSELALRSLQAADFPILANAGDDLDNVLLKLLPKVGQIDRRKIAICVKSMGIRLDNQ